MNVTGKIPQKNYISVKIRHKIAKIGGMNRIHMPYDSRWMKR